MTKRVGTTTILLLLGIVALIFGVAARFVNLNRQTISDDEVWTQLRVAGVTRQDLTKFFDDRPQTVAEWRKIYLVARPGAEVRVVHSLALDEPQWPPLFYLTSYAVERLTGKGLAALRVLAGIFGVATIGAMAWLGYELFGSLTVAAVTAVLAALSPLLVAYSREARGYSLLTLIIAFSSAALLRSAKTHRLFLWTLYGASALAGIATYSLFVAVTAGHAAWLVATRRRLRPFLLAVAPAIIFAVSWFAYGADARKNLAGMLPGEGHAHLWTFLVPKWLYNIALPFYTIDVWNIALGFLVVPIVFVAMFAVAVAARAPAGRRALLFLAAMAFPTTAVLLVLDWHWQKNMTAIARYEFPLWLSLIVIVAAMGADVLTRKRPARQLAVAAIAGTLVILSSVTSTIATVTAPWWWDTWYDAAVPSIVDTINASRDPLVITSRAVSPEDVFANGLRDEVAILPLSLSVLDRCRVVHIDARKRSVFILARPGSLLRRPRQSEADVVIAVVALQQASIAWRFRQWANEVTGRAPQAGWPVPWATYELWSVHAYSTASPRLALDVCP